jgi:hypothetical protein
MLMDGIDYWYLTLWSDGTIFDAAVTTQTAPGGDAHRGGREALNAAAFMYLIARVGRR